MGGGDFRDAQFFPLTFPLQEYFFAGKKFSSGLLALQDFFFTQFSLG